MSKKFTSFLVMLAVMLLTLPSHAQVLKQKLAPAGKNAMEMRTLQKALKVNTAEMAKQKAQAERTLRDAQANELVANWDWAAHAPQQYVPQAGQNQFTRMTAMSKDGKVLTANLAASQRTLDNVIGGQANGSRFAATTDSHGIITAPDQGESKLYAREGMTFSYNQSTKQVSLTAQTGSVEIVEAADGTVYIKDIISTLGMETWVKGTKSGNTITVAGGQPVAWSTNYSTTMSVNWGDYNDGYFSRSTGDITFTIDGDVITLNDAETYDHFIGLYWDDDDSWQAGYGDYATVWTEGYEEPVWEVIELPAGATTEDWFVTGTANSGKVPATAKVAFVGNEVYVQGIFTQLPNAWVMGTKTGNSVAFPKLQYLGTYGQYNIWTWTGTAPDASGSYYVKDEVTFTYDEAAKTLTLDDDQAYVATADNTKWYALDYYTELMLSANEAVVEPIVAPYTSDLSTQAEFKKWTVLDANADGKTWTWDGSYLTHYSWNSSKAADDYLILPIELEAGKNYSVTVNAACQGSSMPEKFEVKVGKAPTAEGLNMTVINETTVRTTEYEDYEGSFSTNEAGTWYVAIHATSDPDMYYLKVRSFSIELGADPAAPAAPANFTAVAGEKGALEVNISLTASTTAINGNTLTGTQTITLYRDDAAVKTFEGVAAGAALTYKDTEVADGKSYVYYAQASNASGLGAKSEKVSVWVGQDAPADVEDVQFVGMPTASSIQLSWSPVEGANGGYIDLAAVQYDITTIDFEDFMGWFTYPVEGETIGSVVGDTTAIVDYAGLDEGEERYEYFGVKAKVGDNASDPTSVICFTLAGAPYELPIEEHFTGSSMHYVWDYNEITGLGVSQDGSDGDVALALTADGADGTVMFESFKLNTKAAANPTLLFDAKKGTSATDQLVVYGLAPNGTKTILETVTLTDEYQTVKVVIPAELAKERWSKIGFNADLENGKNILLDNIKVVDLYEYDLSVAVAAPKSVLAGDTATVKVTVKNEGENEATGYTVTVKAGAEVLLNTTVNEALAPFTAKEFTAELATTIFDDAADVAITATVEYTNDLNEDNNTAETIISIKESTAAPVTEVAAEAEGSTVSVSWTAPDLSAPNYEEVTESFEEGDGGWTFIDADGDGNNWRRVVFVDDNDNPVGSHDGDYSVMSQSYDNTKGALTPDNWLVSPEAVLDGTFKFWAEGVDANYASEHFQIYVSTTSATDVTTFEAVSEEFVATGDWKEYTADLTSYAGANGWIAIRHFNVTDEFALEVDEITYLVGQGGAEIDHFNIYLDGEAVATAAADEVNATLENVAGGEHTVAVSVVYTTGVESKPVATTVVVEAAAYTSSATYAVQVDEAHAAGETVEVNCDEGLAATLTFGFEGGAAFAAGVADNKLKDNGFVAYTAGNGENGAADAGTVYIINPKFDGVITVGVVLNGGKKFYVLEDGEALAQYNGITEAEKYYGTYTFNVVGGKEYKVYCAGSKLGFYGFNYDFNYDETTGINAVKNQFEDGVIYNLQGQKVQNARKGIYIINGKKVVLK